MNSEEEKRFQQIMEQLFGETNLHEEGDEFNPIEDYTQPKQKLDKEMKEAAIEMAKYELDQLRQAFINFQKEIQDLVLLKYSTQFLLDYSSYCEELEGLLLITDESEQEDGNKFIAEHDLRNQILNEIYERYMGQVNEDE
ncbi:MULTISPECIES: hypothetical protein [unclassified Candidatus Frackibacter]|uniref:hypothetical protein n=1 Tax=unclassified Candidatus Frackibacter TaxID=2648818 RepID=UPI00079284A3|nr:MULTISPECIES: hypothetical protein [unclassified Candidatus Frackibacter]KXS41206.1 MAG: hypothetical protein AWU54_1705 [Candidatus Frackibacter sp. T328-2]SDC50228.1 hypothetical protein SAMN04515661_1128 [Candidatus Frackibacter sp. WG11]SEM40230.1 hypothetical protein SAMN04488698_1038 [Candidatus Frackibacter sp. WG12]SFL74611.1 hypothetical protein SAMN04488699_1126 [Candidatus Frackibacter sp. WG13]